MYYLHALTRETQLKGDYMQSTVASTGSWLFSYAANHQKDHINRPRPQKLISPNRKKLFKKYNYQFKQETPNGESERF